MTPDEAQVESDRGADQVEREAFTTVPLTPGRAHCRVCGDVWDNDGRVHTHVPPHNYRSYWE